jgi:two-component system, response regulator PdtaR
MDCIVLVVEDEPLIRMDLIAVLQANGCDTLEAASAADALRVLEHHPEVTVVFTDIQMPGTMDGVQLARHVKARWPNTLVVVSSGKTRPAPGALSEDVPFVGKPYDSKRLTALVTELKSHLAAS